jgi:hypothetical protein
MGMRTTPRRYLAVLAALALLLAGALGYALLRDDAAESADGGALRESLPSASLDAEGADSAAPDSQALPTDQQLIVTAAQQVTVPDVAAGARRLAAEVAAAGGFVSAESTTAAAPCPEPALDGVAPEPCGGQARSTITYRAPLTAVDGLLTFTADLGEESWRTRSATDVGARIADIDARVASARASLDRLNALMARAESLTDIIALEAQIATRQAELESLLAQQAQLADQVALATVTATLVTGAVADESPSGFWAGLQAGAATLASAALAALTALGWALPFLLLVGVLALPVRWLWRRRRPRTDAVVATQREAPAQSDGVASER